MGLARGTTIGRDTGPDILAVLRMMNGAKSPIHQDAGEAREQALDRMWRPQQLGANAVLKSLFTSAINGPAPRIAGYARRSVSKPRIERRVQLDRISRTNDDAPRCHNRERPARRFVFRRVILTSASFVIACRIMPSASLTTGPGFRPHIRNRYRNPSFG
jgi:hypothetical protein